MKHTIKRLFFLAAFSVSVTACVQELDNISPAQEVEQSLVFSSPENVQNALIGAYTRLGNSSLMGGYLQMDAELLAAEGNLRWQGTFNDPRDFYIKSILPQNADVRNLWRRSYEVINITNNILVNGLPIMEEGSEEANRIEAEARFMRGLVYFELVRSFGRPYQAADVNAANSGVPLLLEPTAAITEESYPARATIEEVYNLILADLQFAEESLPEENSVFAVKDAAAAILSRVHLERAEYEQARDYAHAVIERGNFGLATNYANIFNNASSGGPTSAEDIFSIQVTTQALSNTMVTFFASVPEGGRGDVPITASFVELYDEGDQRRAYYYEDDNQLWTGKWTNSIAANVNIVRFAEMLLTRAEANYRLGTEVGATPLEDINRLREARRSAALDEGGLALDDVDLDRILLERELELAFEGHRLHDYRRTQRDIGDIAWDSNQLVYPIPFREVQTNSNLVQNPGY